MLTIQDCIDLSDLSEEEILAIAAHEHIPEMLAVELGSFLFHAPDGENNIRSLIGDEFRHARM